MANYQLSKYEAAMATAEESLADGRWERARAWLLYAQTISQAEWSTRSEERAEEQLTMQRAVAGDMLAMAQLVEEIAESNGDQVGAAHARGWIGRARVLTGHQPNQGENT